jgi:uncharacterized protein YbjT (DUF2867 family)
MYVVIGATGQTGGVVANTLLDAGAKVRVVGRTASKLEQFTKRGAEAAVLDISDLDPVELTKAFSGATAVYAMIPPDLATNDLLAYDAVVTKVIVTALQTAAVERVVLLSSIGADKPANTGPVVGLHRLEQAINALPSIDALYIRAGYFMENLLQQVGVIKSFGMLAGPLRGDLRVPLIATRDIGAYAAAKMLKPDFTGKQARELLGAGDATYNDAARIIGEAIGNPGLAYMQMPPDQLKPALMQMGLTENIAALLLEMADAMNTGQMAALEPRSASNTTSTTLEQFVKDTFLPAFTGRAAGA